MNPRAITPRETIRGYLARLAENLTSNGVSVELADDVAKPYPKVATARAPSQDERVLCQQDSDGLWSFWWPWQQLIGSVDDLDLVMSRIVMVLRSVEADG
jgi:hypothetical protein